MPLQAVLLAGVVGDVVVTYAHPYTLFNAKFTSLPLRPLHLFFILLCLTFAAESVSSSLPHYTRTGAELNLRIGKPYIRSVLKGDLALSFWERDKKKKKAAGSKTIARTGSRREERGSSPSDSSLGHLGSLQVRNSWTVEKVAGDGSSSTHSCRLFHDDAAPEPPPTSHPTFSEKLHPFVCKYEQHGRHLLCRVGGWHLVVKGCRLEWIM